MRHALLAVAFVLSALPAQGQILDTLKDPTTYAPAVITYAGHRLDWDSSQPLFRAGALELNARYTVNGLPNSQPISYAAGSATIRRDAAAVFGLSFAHNYLTRRLQRRLANRYPDHQRLVTIASWCERVAFAAVTSYVASAANWRQWRANERAAAAFGIR